jgi:hypothetical protein
MHGGPKSNLGLAIGAAIAVHGSPNGRRRRP